MSAQRSTFAASYGLWLWAAACVGLALWYAIPATVGLTTELARNYNEGWMVSFAYRVPADVPLYLDPAALAVNNYPPIWYLLLASAQALGFDMNVAGRVLEFLSFGACAVFVYLICRRFEASVSGALAGAAVFLAGAAAWLPGYLGINDPHVLGLAVMLVGVWVALGDRGATSWVVGAAICCVAGFVKHSLMPLPVSLALYFLLTNRRAFWIYSSALGASIVLGFALSTAVWGEHFWAGMSSVSTLDRWKLLFHIQNHFYFYGSAFVGFLIAAYCAWRAPRLAWLPIYLAVAVLFGMFFQLGTGTAGNHYYDTILAMAVCFGVVTTSPAVQGRMPVVLMLVTIAVLLIGSASVTWHRPQARLAALADRTEAEQAVTNALRAIPGNVACEDAMLCAAAGKISQLDFYNIGQRLARDRLELEQVLESLERNGVAAVQFTGTPGSSARLTPAEVERLLEMFPRQVVANAHFTLQARATASPAKQHEQNPGAEQHEHNFAQSDSQE